MAADRRGEAHLWLLLEEALVAVRHDPAAAWEAWRNYRAVADALTAVGALAGEVADALVGELDDALAVRRLVPTGSFTASPWPELDVLDQELPPRPMRAAVAWLEAEIERHLDLLVSFTPEARSWAAADLLRILAGPARALVAVGSTSEGVHRLVEDAAASLAAAGIDPGRAVADDGAARREWVQFLRDGPPPLPEPHEPDERRTPRLLLGEIAGRLVRLDTLAWSADAIDLEVIVRGPDGRADPEVGVPWQARVLDDRGHVHLGQPAVLRGGAGRLRFALRPGVGPGVNRLDLRVTRGGARLEGSVAL